MTTNEWIYGIEEHFMKKCHQELYEQFAVDGVVPTEVRECFDLEMAHVLKNGYFYSFGIARHALALAKECGLHAMIGGNAAYSFLAYLYGLTWINPLEKDYPPSFLLGENFDKAPYFPLIVSPDFRIRLIRYYSKTLEDVRFTDEGIGDETIHLRVPAMETELSFPIQTEWILTLTEYLERKGAAAFRPGDIRPKSCGKEVADILKILIRFARYVDPEVKEDEDTLCNCYQQNPSYRALLNAVGACMGRGVWRAYKESGVPIFTHDELYRKLIHSGVESHAAFAAADKVRKGRAADEQVMDILKQIADSDLEQHLKPISHLLTDGACDAYAQLILYLEHIKEQMPDIYRGCLKAVSRRRNGIPENAPEYLELNENPELDVDRKRMHIADAEYSRVRVSEVPARFAAYFADPRCIKLIGRSRASLLYRYCPEPGNEANAMMIKMNDLKRKWTFQNIVHEREMLLQLQHKPYVVRLLDSAIDYDCRRACLLQEELEPLRRKDLSDPKDVFAMGIKLCDLFDDLRATGIAYNDICLTNIMCRKNSDELVLMNFTCATPVDQPPSDIVGTPYYIAPEIIEEKYYSESGEVYALGVLLSRLLLGEIIPWYFPYDDAPTIRPPYDTEDLETLGNCLKAYEEPSEIDVFFGKYPSLGRAVNMDRSKRILSFIEFKEMLLKDSRK